MSKLAVMRRPVLPEDEGRHFLLKVCDSRKEADDFIDEYTEYDKGYFHKCDLYVLEEIDDYPRMAKP